MECQRKFSNRKTLHTVIDDNTKSKIKKLNVTVQSKTSLKSEKSKDSGIDMLDDSFMCFDDTQMLINKNNNEDLTFANVIDNVEMPHCSFRSRTSQFRDELKNHTQEYDSSQISQFFNRTQVLDQLDSIVTEANLNVKCDIFEDISNVKQNSTRVKENNCASTSSTTFATKKYDDLLVKLNCKNIHEDKENFSTSTSFINKEEVSNLFSKLETTIRDMGGSEHQGMITDQNQETMKNIKLLNTIVHKVKSSKSDQEDHWLNETEIGGLLNMTEIEMFPDILKENSLLNEFKTQGFANELANIKSWKSLGNFYDLPHKVKHLIKSYKGIEKLYDWQHECLNLPAIKNRKNLIYALPTSGGKTLVAEILLFRELLCRNKNVIFVLPYVAIVQEKVWGLSPFAVALDFLIEEYAGAKGSYPPRKRRRKNSVYIATIEKALGLVNSLIESERISEIGLVVIDELHLVGDKSRGPTLESLLTKLMHLNRNIHIIGMSATIGNLNEIGTFLNAEIYTGNFRPVDLVEYVKCNDDIAKVNYNAGDEDELFKFERKLDTKYSETLLKTDPDKLTALVMEVVPQSSCLIFCSTKKNCENVALVLCKVMFAYMKDYKKAEKSALLEALKNETQSLCRILKISVQFGVAYHHSGLTMEERQLIEHGFREGIISVICCTSTLAAGVNLPAKRVILRQPYIGRDFINLSRYKQMVGRAGRAGFEEYGESFLICTKMDLPKVKSMLMSPMDLSISNMQDERELMQFILSCISLSMAETRQELQVISCKTLLAIQESRLNVNLKQLVDKAIKELFKLRAIVLADVNTSEKKMGAQVNTTINTSIVDMNATMSSSSINNTKTKVIVKNHSKLQVSNLGLAAIKGGLDITKAHLLYEDILQAQASLVLLNCLHLIYLVTPYEVSEQIQIAKPHYYNIYSQLAKTELQTAKVLGLDESCALKLLTNKPIKNIPDRVLNRFYVSLMLFDLWNEMPVYAVSEKFQVGRGIVQNLMVSAASFASSVVNFCAVLEEFWSFACLLSGMSLRLQHCCVRELMPLMELPNVKQNRARQLFNAGYKTLQSIAKADPNELVEKIEYMSRKIANQLIATSKMLLLEKVENLREEAEDVLEGTELSV